MKTKNTLYYIIISVFVIAEAAIYIAFNVLAGMDAADPVALKYSGIILCLAAALGFIYFFGRDGIYLSVAMVFTALSDLFIFVLDDFYELGVGTFIIAQAVYMLRLYDGRFRKLYMTGAIRVLLMGALIIALKVLGVLDLLVTFVAIYIVMLLANLAEAIMRVRRSFKHALFAVGLALFLCCDVCVGLNNFGSVLGVQLPDGALRFVSVAMWAFYLPSQVCIVCSARKGGISVRENIYEQN